MKRFLSLFSIVAAALCFACCNHNEPEDTQEVLQFSSVPINIGQADGSELFDARTRSQITIDSESFVCAYLFAFDASTKKILSYPTEWTDHQGEQGGPVAKYTESKTFNWALPLNTNFDVWVVVNPGTEFEDFLADALEDEDLRESDLYGDNMVFSCPSSSALKALDVSTDGTGIPMSGRMDNQRLTSASQGITISVKRLFAKYNIRFDVSAYTNEGYTVNAFSIRGSKSNTEVPFFYDGYFAQTNRSKLNVIDYGTSSDLEGLNEGDYVTLYFLENCQGTKSGVQDWNTVYRDLNSSDPTLDYCSYIEVAVNVTRPAGVGYEATDESFIHRVYVGETFLDKNAHTYNFDVKRNLFQTLKIYLKPAGDDVPPPPETFKFTNTNTLSVEPGETITVPWASNGIDMVDLSFASSNPSLLAKVSDTRDGGSVTFNGATYSNSGTVTYRAANNSSGADLVISGGKNLGSSTGEVKDSKSVAVRTPIIFQDIEIDCDVHTEFNDAGTWFSQTVTGHGEDMSVPVKSHEGSSCTFVLNANVKYNDTWHQMSPQTGNPTPRISFWWPAFGEDIPANRSILHWGGTLNTGLEMPGDTEEVRIYFEDQMVASWTITFGSSGSTPGSPGFQEINLTCEATVLGSSYAQSNTFSSNGEDMQILVDAAGNYVTYIVTGQVKYDDAWHDITTDSNMHLSVGSETKSWTFTTGGKVYSGSTSYFQVFYGTMLVKSWTVTAVNAASEILFDLSVTAISNGSYVNGSGSDMHVGVAHWDGNDVSVSITGQIYYSGAWHNVRNDSNLKCYVDNQLDNDWSWSYEQAPGDQETVSIKLNGIVIKSWTIYYE